MEAARYEPITEDMIEAIRNPEGQAEGAVITAYLDHLLQREVPKAAFLLPHYTANFFAMNENVLELIKTDPTAYPAADFLHGNMDFDVLLVPFHVRQCDAWRGGEHWMMAIYDKSATSGRQFIMFDPKPKTNAQGRPILEDDHH